MSYLSYLSPVAHEISSKRKQICRRVLHGYFHPMATPSYIGHLFKLEVDVVPLYFCHRIASECMMMISSDQYVFVMSLFIDSGSMLFLPTVDTGHWPLTQDT